MKNTVITALLCSLLLVQSCAGLLDETSREDIDKNTYMNDAAQAESVLLGIYRYMVLDGTYAYNLSMIFPLGTDISRVEGNNTVNFREIPSNAHTATHRDIQLTWQTLYEAIYNANDFIETATEKLASFGDKDRALLEIYIGEAKALRALYYFELVRWYGNIAMPLTAEESYLPADQVVQVPAVKVYEQIEKDLKEAAEAMPWSTADNKRSNSSYRFSRGAAIGLLTKVYATWAGYPVRDESKWERAASTAAMIVTSGRHSLNPVFEDLWYNTCNQIWEPQESLLEVGFYNIAGYSPAGRIGKFNGVRADAIAGQRGANGGYVKIVFPFLQEWVTRNDPRCDLSIASFQYTGNNKVPYSTFPIDDTGQNARWWNNSTPAKWDTEKYVSNANYMIDANYSNINWYLLRYSDVLLLYAEALNEANNGPTAEAYKAINEVRRRGYGQSDLSASAPGIDLPDGLGYEDFREAVRLERAYELCFEGHRRQDLIRWGIYYESVLHAAGKLWNWYSGADYTIFSYIRKGKHEIFPIPQRDLDLLKKFEQNEGWK